jgi:peptide/nickel transport system permease protein
MPVFWLGVILQIIFFGRLGWLPAAGRLPPAEIGVPTVTGFTTVDALLANRWDLFLAALKHMVLPVLTLSAINLATIARISRSTLLEVLHQRYIVVARGKGLRESLIMIRHALPNAIIPLVTIFGLMIGESLQGSVVIETIFAWPGIGRRVINSLLRADIPMISAYALLLAIAYGVTNLLVDLSYYILDPRIRSK